MDPLARSVTDEQFLKLLSVWELIRTRHREIPAQAITVLLYVASHNPCHKQAIEEDQGLTTASCSRMIDLLHEGPGRAGVSGVGLGLITKEYDLSNKRRLLIRLSSSGQSLVQEIKQILS